MTNDRHREAADDEHALSEYLAGELDAGRAQALEQRLAAEPALRRRLDALADALTALGGFDDAVPPAGFEQRLAQRLDRERDAQPTDLATHRRRRDRSRTWLSVGAAAAVLVLGAVMAGGTLGGLRAGDEAGVAEDTAMDDAGAPEAAGDAQLESAGDSRPTAPVILDEQVAIADEEALRSRYEQLPEAVGLLGVPAEEAEALAARFTAAVDAQELSAAALSAGDEGGDTAEGGAGTGEADGDDQRAAGADPCLSAITADTDAPLVPVRVETLRYAGRDALAYVLVTVSERAGETDRTEVWVVDPSDCNTLVFQQY